MATPSHPTFATLICLDCGLEGIVGDAAEIDECPDCQGDVV